MNRRARGRAQFFTRNPSLGEDYFAVSLFSARYDRWHLFQAANTMKIPPNLREYFYNLREHFYIGARIASAILVVVGIATFWTAVSFEGYLLALIALALAGCSVTGAEELKAYLGRRPGEQQVSAAMMPDDAGSSPGSAA